MTSGGEGDNEAVSAMHFPDLIAEMHDHAGQTVEHDVDAGAARLNAWIGKRSKRSAGGEPSPPPDSEKFAVFYQRMIIRIRTHLVRLGAPPELAQDLAQEAVMEAYVRWSTLKNPHRWVVRQAVSQFRAHQKALREATSPSPSAAPEPRRPRRVTCGSLVAEIRFDQDVTVCTLTGELDMLASPRLRDELLSLVDAGRKYIVLEVSAVRFFDSTGLGVLLLVRRRLQDKGGAIALAGAQPLLIRLLTLLNLLRELPAYPSLATATSAVLEAAAVHSTSDTDKERR
ncbi:anti-sigma factor antagonist [Cryptosporangium sp. NPDC048952]|uniref:anti-sigma factor antagonist n=1 Tax=Cryptosporangium sp. NPDC048952 TaxID=3363961 RepID=UPI003714F6DF